MSNVNCNRFLFKMMWQSENERNDGMQCNYSAKSRSMLPIDSTGNTTFETNHRLSNATIAFWQSRMHVLKCDLQHANASGWPTLRRFARSSKAQWLRKDDKSGTETLTCRVRLGNAYFSPCMALEFSVP